MSGALVSAPDRAGLFALCLAAFVSMASMRLCDPLLPALAGEFEVSLGESARAVSFFAVAYGLTQLLFGPLGDRHGKFLVIALAALGCVAGNALAATADDLDQLLLARALSGAAAGGIIPLSLAWIGDTVGYAQRQEVLGHLMVATLLGTVFGQWSAGLLADTVGWRWAFLLVALMFAAIGTLLLRMAPVRASGLTRDGRGFGREVGQVLGRPWARWILALTVVEGAFAFAALAFVPAHLHETFGLSLNAAAAVAALLVAGGLVYAIQARRMVAGLGEPGLVIVGAASFGGSLILLALARHWLFALPACVFAGLGFAMLHATLQTHATQMAPDVRGTATALFGASIFIGQAFGVLAGGSVVDQEGFEVILVPAGGVIAVLGLAFGASLARRQN